MSKLIIVQGSARSFSETRKAIEQIFGTQTQIEKAKNISYKILKHLKIEKTHIGQLAITV